MSKSKNYYCPFCGEKTKFKQNTKLNVKNCEKCGISDQDFYVKMENKLWENINKQKRR